MKHTHTSHQGMMKLALAFVLLLFSFSAFSISNNSHQGSNVILPPSDLYAFTVNSTMMRLEWQDNSDNELAFQIEQLIDGVFEQVATASNDGNGILISNLSEGGTYSFRMRAVGNFGMTSVYSEVVTKTLEESYFTITAIESDNGSISPDGEYLVQEGFDQTFTFTPDAGSFVAQVIVNGEYIGAAAEYTFERVENNQTIEVLFVPESVRPAAPSDLYVFAVNSTTMRLEWQDNSDNELSFSIEQLINGVFTEVAVASNDGNGILISNLSEGETYSFRMRAVTNFDIASEYSEVVTKALEENILTITAIESDNGSISPDGENLVQEGFDQIFTITPDEGFFTAQVFVNDIGIGVLDSYTFERVESNQTIEAIFVAESDRPAAPSNLIAFSTNSTTMRLEWQDNSDNELSFSIEQLINGVFTEVAVASNDGSAILISNLSEFTTYSFRVRAVGNFDIASDYSEVVTKTLEENLVTIFAIPGPNGSITPDFEITLNEGESQDFVITPDAGYEIDEVLINGIVVAPSLTYSFNTVLENQTIDVTFKSVSAGNCTSPLWDADMAYSSAGTLVTFEGKVYRNRWWTRNEEPTTEGYLPSASWELVEFCSAAGLDCSSINSYSSSQVYSGGGNLVEYQGNIYKNFWYTSNSAPSTSDAWWLIGPCSSSSVAKSSAFSNLEGSEKTLSVWPNPVDNSFVNIDFDAPTTNAKIELLDAQGRTVSEQIIENGALHTVFDLRSVDAGHYLIKASGEELNITEHISVK